jgi:DNA topoisomerase-3
MKTLIIAEKPSVARDIAAALGGFSEQSDKGGKWLERGDAVISSAIGHLVELACPENEDPGYNLQQLPVIPSRFSLAPIEGTKSQLVLLKRLMVRPDVQTVVNACDAGREGELIFRSIYLFCGCRKPMSRMWLQSMTASAIKAAHTKMRPGRELDTLFYAAQSRSEADWLVGINGTRAVSILQGALAGERVKTTVGRVQTPTLYLVVEREETIRNFVAKPYWEVHATFAAKAGGYGAKWCQARFILDKNTPDAKADRLFDKARADAVLRRCQGKAPSSVADTSTEVTSGPPKLFDLTTLQREANRKFGLSAKQTLDIAQALYEKHKVLTYPRTDSNALPEDYIETAKTTLGRLGQAGIPLSPAAAKAVGMVKPDKRIFNNAKISDHFAIIPTGMVSNSLDGNEAKIFDLVARRFIAAFYPSAKYLQTERITVVEGEQFRSSGRVLVEEGWLAVYGREVDDKDDPALCLVAKGELPANREMKLVALKTAPPARYTEATLLGAMESAGAGIEDDELREAMKERGLGTPATRAATIEKLLHPKVAYMERQKKNLVPTAKAFALVDFLRANGLMALAAAQTTGEWEFKLRQMEQGKVARPAFMAEITTLARDIVERVRANAKDLPAMQPKQSIEAPCPKCGGQLLADGKTMGCNGCGFKLWKEIAGRPLSDQEALALVRDLSLPTLSGFLSKAQKPFSAGLALADDLSGKVEFVFAPRSANAAPAASTSTDTTVVGCPQCGKPMRQRQGAKGAFWGCSGYPDCRCTMEDNGGSPVAHGPGQSAIPGGHAGVPTPGRIVPRPARFGGPGA